MARDWIAETLRLSLFSAEAVSLADADWTQLTGQEEAETRQLIPGGGKRYIGNVGSRQLTVTAAGPRADIVLSPLAESQEQFQFSTLGHWKDAIAAFLEVTDGWLTQVSFPVIRIAFGAILLSETKGVFESYEALQGLLKSVAVQPGKMRELIYRINWPQESKAVKGLSLNRITNWSGVQVSAVLLQVGSGVTTAGGRPEKFAVRLEIDHNN